MFEFLRKNKKQKSCELKLLFLAENGYEEISEFLIRYISENYSDFELENYRYNLEKFYEILQQSIRDQMQILDDLKVFDENNGLAIKECKRKVSEIELFNIRFPTKFSNIKVQNIIIEQFPDFRKVVDEFQEKYVETIKRLYPATQLSVLAEKKYILSEKRKVRVDEIKKHLMDTNRISDYCQELKKDETICEIDNEITRLSKRIEDLFDEI